MFGLVMFGLIGPAERKVNGAPFGSDGLMADSVRRFIEHFGHAPNNPKHSVAVS